MATPGTDDVGGLKASDISELRRTAKWHDPSEEIKEEDDLLTGEELKLFQSVAAMFNFLAMDRPDHLHSIKELMRKMDSQRTQDVTAPKRVARYTIKYPRMTCRYRWTELASNIEVLGDANFALCTSTRKSTVGGVAMWSGQFVKAWSKTMGGLALSSGESALAAVVRAATEGMGLQSILNAVSVSTWRISLTQLQQSGWSTGLDLEKSDIWLLEIFGWNIMFVQGKFESPKCQDWRIRAMHKPSILGPETIVTPHKCLQLGSCRC